MQNIKPRSIEKLSHKDKINYIRLIRSENVGSKTFMNLLMLYKTIEQAISSASELASRAGKKIKITSYCEAEAEYEKTLTYGADIIAFSEESYSYLLSQIEDFPPIITILGNKDILLKQDNVAIIGSRNFSANGYNFTKKIVQELIQQNYIITSGLARGIDTAAHTSALETKCDSTIAVIAGGIDNIYPPENGELYSKIKENGLIIAEMPYGAVPKSQNFPRRNRIISGLSKAVVIMEASLKSGSLITARFALEQNREIFAVPGFPLDPRYSGNNKLIKEGAQLLSGANCIINHFKSGINLNLFSERNDNFQAASNISVTDQELNTARIDINKILSSTPISIDELIEITQFSVSVILIILLELELAGKIERHFGNKVSKIY